MNEIVNIDGLKNVSELLYARSEDICYLYKDKILPLLDECKKYYDDRGKNFIEEKEEYQKIYDSIVQKLQNLSELLNTSVIKDYVETKDYITAIFKNDFKEKFNEILGQSTKDIK